MGNFISMVDLRKAKQVEWSLNELIKNGCCDHETFIIMQSKIDELKGKTSSR